MEGLIKNKVFLFSVILNFSLFILALTSCSETQRQKNLAEKEIFNRMEFEEQKQKAEEDKLAVEESMKSLTKQLEEEKASHELTKRTLEQEQLLNKGLKQELNKVTKTRDKI